ncbi:restriction endonuclease subunit S [Pseudomonas sp. NPDC089569]|uniref:restriction endonuclease subunit S n=1 Tax=Pseudomonas sp. NPDC089569 TaxID=3390722 RepID=UPI003D002C78
MAEKSGTTLYGLSTLRQGRRFFLERIMPTRICKLSELADVRSGHTFRGALEHDPAGDVRVLQIKDLRQRAVIEPESLISVRWEGSKNPPSLMAGEIAVVARGDTNTAALYREGQRTVATSQFFVVTPKTAEVLPEYLCWMINIPQSQRNLERSGSSIQAISKSSLMDMQIPLPSLETQERLTQLQRLWDEEDQLIAQLHSNREQMLQGIYQQLIKERP